MTKLGVNIDHIATLRNVRQGIEPDPVFASYLCQIAGADSIVAHLREDRRHILDRDVLLLKETVRVKFNLEMSVDPAIVNIACRLKPNQATLVPERRKEITTEGGLDVLREREKIRRVVDKLRLRNIGVSLFIDPDPRQIDAALGAGIRMVELHTGRFADAKTSFAQEKTFRQLSGAARQAKSSGLQVFAGHGLNYTNAKSVAQIQEIEELNIGYSIICRASLVGLESAVRQMKELIS